MYKYVIYFCNDFPVSSNEKIVNICFTISLVDCKWSPWGPWDVCTRTCGGGMQARSRTIVEQERHGGKPCVGDPQEMQGCNMQACPSKYNFLTKFLETIHYAFLRYVNEFTLLWCILLYLVCKDSPRYARFCPSWTIYCSNSEFVKGCCKKSCRLC